MESNEKEKLLSQAAKKQLEAERLMAQVIALRQEADALVKQASGPVRSEPYVPLLAP